MGWVDVQPDKESDTNGVPNRRRAQALTPPDTPRHAPKHSHVELRVYHWRGGRHRKRSAASTPLLKKLPHSCRLLPLSPNRLTVNALRGDGDLKRLAEGLQLSTGSQWPSGGATMREIGGAGRVCGDPGFGNRRRAIELGIKASAGGGLRWRAELIRPTTPSPERWPWSVGQTNPRRPAGQVVCDYGPPLAAKRPDGIQPDAVLEVSYGVLDRPPVPASRRVGEKA